MKTLPRKKSALTLVKLITVAMTATVFWATTGPFFLFSKSQPNLPTVLYYLVAVQTGHPSSIVYVYSDSIDLSESLPSVLAYSYNINNILSMNTTVISQSSLQLNLPAGDNTDVNGDYAKNYNRHDSNLINTNYDSGNVNVIAS